MEGNNSMGSAAAQPTACANPWILASNSGKPQAEEGAIMSVGKPTASRDFDDGGVKGSTDELLEAQKPTSQS